MPQSRSTRRSHIPSRFTSLVIALSLAGCAGAGSEGGAEPEAGAQSTGDEQAAAEQEQEQAQAQADAEAAAQQDAEQQAAERAMEEVVKLSMQLGSQRVALAKQLDKPQPDCERSEELRDRICETAANICSISEAQQEAVGHCDRSSGKCERARRDVEDLQCRRGRRRG